MYNSDSSDYELTYEQEEKIKADLEKERKRQNKIKAVNQLNRQRKFKECFDQKEDLLFQLKGLEILKFTHLKVKFMFIPSEIIKYVSNKVAFFCSLKYLERYDKWCIKRDSFPVTYKWRIYPLFYESNYFAIEDDSLLLVIAQIYKRLILWCEREEEFRMEKFLRYQHGEDVQLDTDDEEIFLSEEDILELRQKRNAILNRMIPPERRLRKRRRPRRIIDSDSD